MPESSPLPPTPSSYVAEREDAHRLAYAVVAEARRVVTNRFGLRWTPGGFGTPVFGDDRQVRVDGVEIVVQAGATIRSEPITTLAAAGRFVGVKPATEAAEGDSPALGDTDRTLSIGASTMRLLDSWFGLAWAVLEDIRTDPTASDAGKTQLWPGHFDPAVEIGDADRGQRATFGASPGDDSHDHPYLFVGPWGEIDTTDDFWNADSFTGAMLPFVELAAANDQHACALEFYRAALARLTS